MRKHQINLTVGSAVAAAAALVGLAGPARAQPMLPQGPATAACRTWAFDGPFVIDGWPDATGDSSWHVSFNSTGFEASGPVVLAFDDGQRTTGHFVDDGYGITGDGVVLAIRWDDKPNNVWDLGGSVNDRGFASGYEQLPGGPMSAHWEGRHPLTCVAPLGTYGPDTCAQGFVWREASPTDHVCVLPTVRDASAQQNGAAAQNREPGGGAYGADTCKQGFVWRDAVAGDHVCVLPGVRDAAAAENAAATTRLAPR